MIVRLLLLICLSLEYPSGVFAAKRDPIAEICLGTLSDASKFAEKTRAIPASRKEREDGIFNRWIISKRGDPRRERKEELKRVFGRKKPTIKTIIIGDHEYRIIKKLPESQFGRSSDIFISDDGHVLKKYTTLSDNLYVREKLLTEFYAKHKIPVSQIVAFDDKTRTIVRRYIPGKNLKHPNELSLQVFTKAMRLHASSEVMDFLLSRGVPLNNALDYDFADFNKNKVHNLRIVPGSDGKYSIVVLDP